MPASRYVAVRIPGNRVCGAFIYVQVAVRALPHLVVIGTRAGRGLHNVFDAVLDFSSLDSRANCIEVQLRNLVVALAFWSIAAWH